MACLALLLPSSGCARQSPAVVAPLGPFATVAPDGSAISHLGRRGPAYRPGVTPEGLGWGADASVYAASFAVNPQDGAEMIWVPAGEFAMGSDHAGYEERPLHRVRLTRGFWAYRHEVTNAQFRRMRPDHRSGAYEGLSVDEDLQPAVNVTWGEARAYATWAGMALPTEAQWEYAARAGTTTDFYWGDDPHDAGRYANLADLAAKRVWPWWTTSPSIDNAVVTAPVGQYVPNPWGLYDAIGNVFEWCADWFAADAYYRPPSSDDPVGPASGRYRVTRGGSWDTYPNHSTVTYRNWLVPPEGRHAWLGLRCVSAR